MSAFGQGSRECRRDGTYRTILQRFLCSAWQGGGSRGPFQLSEPKPLRLLRRTPIRVRVRLPYVDLLLGASVIAGPLCSRMPRRHAVGA